jgi:hypothetical protein
MPEYDQPAPDPDEAARLKRLDAIRGMDLLPDEIKETLPELYSGEKLGLDALARVKFFTPDSQWYWYASEFDGQDLCFGLVAGLEIELGYFSVRELRGLQGSLGLPIERDLSFEPQSLGDLMERHKQQRGVYAKRWIDPMPGKEAPQPEPGFAFTENEQIFYRVSHARFLALFDEAETDVHRVELSANSYGEFVFVTMSRQGPAKRQPTTFFGMGYHEHRERWIHEEWFWYKANAFASTTATVMDKDEARELLRERREAIAPHAADHQQSQRGQFFEMLAEITDDDGAVNEMEDLGARLDDWLDDEAGSTGSSTP